MNKALKATLCITGFVVLECATVLGLFQILNAIDLACGLWFFVLFGFLRHVKRNRFTRFYLAALARIEKVTSGPEFSTEQHNLLGLAVAEELARFCGLPT